MKTYDKFAEDNGITLSYVKVKDRPDNIDMEGDHYYCTLKRNKKTYVFYFTKGYGLKGGPPTLSEILECFCMDIINTATPYTTDLMPFEEWEREFGYDPDSIKASVIYKALKKQNKSLERVLGKDLLNELTVLYQKGD